MPVHAVRPTPLTESRYIQLMRTFSRETEPHRKTLRNIGLICLVLGGMLIVAIPVTTSSGTNEAVTILIGCLGVLFLFAAMILIALSQAAKRWKNQFAKDYNVERWKYDDDVTQVEHYNKGNLDSLPDMLHSESNNNNVATYSIKIGHIQEPPFSYPSSSAMVNLHRSTEKQVSIDDQRDHFCDEEQHETTKEEFIDCEDEFEIFASMHRPSISSNRSWLKHNSACLSCNRTSINRRHSAPVNQKIKYCSKTSKKTKFIPVTKSGPLETLHSLEEQESRESNWSTTPAQELNPGDLILDRERDVVCKMKHLC